MLPSALFVYHLKRESRDDMNTVFDKLYQDHLQEMVQAIVNEVDPYMIILFGSQARGTPTDDSDIDLIVIESEPFTESRSRHTEAVKIGKALAGFDVETDVLVYTRDEVDYWRDSINNVLARALREGNILYERR